jgi:hypothetical protein
MRIPVTLTGFNKLDLDEAKRIARMVEFDVLLCARELGRGCGPGKAYLAQDRRYYMNLLLNHIEKMVAQGDLLAPEVYAWYKKAKAAAHEHQEIQESHLRKRREKR